MKYLILLLLVLPLVQASVYTELTYTAKELQTDDDYRTVQAILYHVQSNIEYKPYFLPRGIKKTWVEKKGDCTDQAIVARYMLNQLHYEVRFLHGIVRNGTLHDWFEVRINKTWYYPGTIPKENLIRVGMGIW